MEIKLSPELFRMHDPKVEALLKAKFPVDVFAAAILPTDPYALVGDTVYPLTECEYYALRSVVPMQENSEAAFDRIVRMEDLSFMRESDVKFVEEVRKSMDHCTSCTLKRYKNEMWKLAKKYNVEIPGELKEPAPLPPYPRVDGEITPVVSRLVEGVYRLPPMKRKECIDCVEKHLGQAYVLACESRMGYGEYIAGVMGHLGEAFDELPEGFDGLKATIQLCLAKTAKERRAYVPLYAITPLLEAARDTLKLSLAEQQDIRSDSNTENMPMDLDGMCCKSLSSLGDGMKDTLRSLLEKADKIVLEYKKGPSPDLRVEWEGLMGNAADILSPIAPEAANILRNRRLMFTANPGLSADAEYTCADFREHLRTSP